MPRRLKTVFVVEHGFIMATYLADRVIVFEGSPSVNATELSSRKNRFLELMGININKNISVKGAEQKIAGQYFSLKNIRFGI
jgi:ATP-binding cassette subfamily E protein 1